MEYEEDMDNDNSFDDGADVSVEDDTKTNKQRKFEARRRIEDWSEFRRMRDDLGWMDDFDADFGDIY